MCYGEAPHRCACVSLMLRQKCVYICILYIDLYAKKHIHIRTRFSIHLMLKCSRARYAYAVTMRPRNGEHTQHIHSICIPYTGTTNAQACSRSPLSRFLIARARKRAYFVRISWLAAGGGDDDLAIKTAGGGVRSLWSNVATVVRCSVLMCMFILLRHYALRTERL